MSVIACSSDSETTAISTDLNGNWLGSCIEADTSQTPLSNIYYNNRLSFSNTEIVVSTTLFSDSDCTIAEPLDFQGGQFSEGSYSLGNAFTTETGLTAYPLTITVVDSNQAIMNIVSTMNGTMYFGFDPFSGPDENLELPPTVLDLQNTYVSL